MPFSLPTHAQRFAAGFAVVSLVLATGACATSGGASETNSGDTNSGETNSGGTLRVGIDATYPPYEYKEGSEYHGFEVDTLRAVAEVLNKDITFVDMKYTATTGAVQAGRIDTALDGAGPDSPERQEVVISIEELVKSPGLIVPEGNPEGFSDFASLCGHAVSVFTGHLEETLQAASDACAGEPMKISALSDANGPYAALQTKRVDAYFGDYIQSTHQATELGAYEAIQVADGETYPGCIYVGLDQEDLAQDLAGALQEVIDSGQQAEIAAKYGLDDSVILDEVRINGGDIPVED